MKIRPDEIMQQITGLLLAYPELAEDDVLRADMIEGETDVHEFLRAVERRRQEAAHMAGAIAGNISELEIRQGRFEGREQALRTLIFRIMNAADLRKLELPEATLSIRQGTPRVIIIDSRELPDEFCRIVREPDKKKIADELKAGNPLPGAVLSNANETLSIRTK